MKKSSIRVLFIFLLMPLFMRCMEPPDGRGLKRSADDELIQVVDDLQPTLENDEQSGKNDESDWDELLRKSDESDEGDGEWLCQFAHTEPVFLSDYVDADKCRPLLEAAAKGDLEAVVTFLQHGGQWVNAYDSYWRAALHFAVRYQNQGHLELVRLLLAHGADPNIEDNLAMGATDYAFWMTPLFYALKNKADEIVTELLIHGAKLSVCNKGGQTPLLWAAQFADARHISQLLDHGADPHARDEGGENVLFLPTTLETARILLEHGADVTSRNKHGHLCLNDYISYLLENGQYEESLCARIREYIRWGALPAPFTQRTTGRIIASRQIMILTGQAFQHHPLFLAAAQGDVSRLIDLVNKSTSLDDRNEALVYAAAHRQKNAVEWLLGNGAEPHRAREVLIRIMARPSLSGEDKTEYAAIESALNQRLSLREYIMNIIRRADLLKPLADGFDALPLDLKTPLCEILLLRGVQKRNLKYVTVGLNAGADIKKILFMVHTLKDCPEIAFLIVSRAHQLGIPFSPAWMKKG